jgi:hypothetical protein
MIVGPPSTSGRGEDPAGKPFHKLSAAALACERVPAGCSLLLAHPHSSIEAAVIATSRRSRIWHLASIGGRQPGTAVGIADSI